MTTPRRIMVIGASGSGKSFLAARLAADLALPLLASDGIFWTPEWSPAPIDSIRAWLTAALAAPAWVMDGNFDEDREMLWHAADLIVWLDLSLPLTVSRVVRRNMRWWASRSPVWGLKRMTLVKAWGGVRHAARSHRRKRHFYPSYLDDLHGVEIVVIRSSQQLRRWLSSLHDPSSPH